MFLFICQSNDKIIIYKIKLIKNQICIYNSNPRHSRGFFIYGPSPLILEARVTSRWYGLPIARDCYLSPVSGFRSYPSSLFPSLVFINCRLIAWYTPVSSVHSSLLCLRSTPGTNILDSDIYISAPGTFRRSSDCFFPFKYPMKLDTAILGGISTSICSWSGHTSASTILIFFQLHRVLNISPISRRFSP